MNACRGRVRDCTLQEQAGRQRLSGAGRPKVRYPLPPSPPPGVPGTCGEGEEDHSGERGLGVYEAALPADYSDRHARRLEWWAWGWPTAGLVNRQSTDSSPLYM